MPKPGHNAVRQEASLGILYSNILRIRGVDTSCRFPNLYAIDSIARLTDCFNVHLIKSEVNLSKRQGHPGQ